MKIIEKNKKSVVSETYPSELPYKTRSICPECKRTLDAEVYAKKGKVYIKRECPEHGKWDELYWGSEEEFNRAKKYASEARGLTNTNVGMTNNTGTNCPYDCGLCTNHHSHTALANIALTNRCDLSCWYCFFYAKEGDPIYEPTVDQIRLMLRNLKAERPVPCNAVQFSVGSDQRILVKDLNGIVFSKNIGEFIDNQMSFKKPKSYSSPIKHERIELSGWEALTVDKDFNSSFKPIKEIIRHKNSEPLFEIVADKGWRIKVTGSHCVFVLDKKGKLVEKRSNELKKGDILIGALSIPSNEKKLKQVDLIDLFSNSQDFDVLKNKIMVSGIKKTDWKNLEKQLKRRVSWDAISFGDYCLLKEKIGNKLRYFNSKKEKEISTELVLTNELARLLGYFAGEGCFYKGGLIFSFGLKEKELIKDCLFCIKKVFGDTNIRKIINHGSSMQLYIEGFLYKELLKVLGCGCSAKTKKVPWIVFNSNDSFKKNFLKSYFDCDGNVRMRKAGFEIVHNTVSKELATDLALLHSQLEIVCQLNTSVSKPHLIKKTGQRINIFSKKYVVSIIGKENLSKSLWYLGKEKSAFEKYCRSKETHAPTYERLPVFDFIRSISRKGVKEKRVADILKSAFFDKSISRTKMNTLIHFFKQNNLAFENVCNHLSTTKSVGFFRIKKINKVNPSSEYVYDISIPDSESFFTGSFGQLLAHNTGGEPTLREDLFEIIEVAREEGYEHIQLNTTGMTIAFNPGYAQKLKDAGVATLYVSFDGTSFQTNPKNHFEMAKTIMECRKAKLGIVLVPTLIKGVNDKDLANIIDFALQNIDIIRGIDIQPVSFVGRMPKSQRDAQRITISDAIDLIEKQTKGIIKKKDFFTIPCVSTVTNFIEALTENFQYSLDNHFACGAATYVFIDKENNKVIPLPEFIDVDALFSYLKEMTERIKSGKSKKLESAKLLLKLKSFINNEKKPKELNLAKLLFNALIKHDYSALGEFHVNSLFIGMMHFMDPYNYDQQRVERCDIHYALPDGRIIPFCAFNVVPELYRDKVQNQYSVSWDEFRKMHPGKDPMQKYKRDSVTLKNDPAYKEVYKGKVYFK